MEQKKMNMISTGAFLPEMDASNKQETLAEQFARVWEKKNSKVARAGGVSLMALSLAACGSSSTTPAASSSTGSGSDSTGDSTGSEAEEETTVVDTDGDGIADADDLYPNDATNTPPGETYTLTSTQNIFEGGSGRDTFTAAQANAGANDIIDGGDGDDIMNLTITSAFTNQITVSNVETINVESQLLTGGTVLDATNIRDATIVVSINKFGNDGAATVLVAGENNVTAGAEVDTLTVTDITTATIDAGSATAVVVDDTATGEETITVVAHGDLDLTATTLDADDTVIVTGASVLTLNTGSSLFAGTTVTAEGATVENAGDEATGTALTAAVAEVDDTTADVADWTVDSIVVTGAGGADLDGAADGQSITVETAQTGGTIDATGATGAETVTINTAVDLNDVDTATYTNTIINVSADVDVAGTATATDTITVTGTGDVDIGTLALATTLDASGLTGELTISTSIGAAVEVLGASGATTYTTGTATNTFVGQGGDDSVTLGVLAASTDRFAAQFGGGDDTLTIDAASMENDGTVIADMGEGDNTVALDLDTNDSGTLTLTGGSGTDTLALDDAADLAAATVELTGFDVISVADANAGASAAMGVTLDGSQIDGLTLTASVDASSEAVASNADTLVVNVTVDEATTGLGDITLGTGVTTAITGNDNTAETIVGTKGDDTIDAGIVAGATEANTLTGGEGDDTFVFAAGDSDATTTGAYSTITDFQTGPATGDNDTISLDSSAEGAGADDTAVTILSVGDDQAAGTVAVGGAAAAADGLATTDVTALLQMVS
jgi:hypothetical protein